MLSKLKNMPGVAWLVIGVIVTALIMPTAAFAAGITWNRDRRAEQEQGRCHGCRAARDVSG